MEYVSHPFIKEGTIEKRPYQEKILANISATSSLVVLPTGLGKTIIAAMLVAHTLASKGGKILFLAPTRPLVMQHVETFRSVFDIAENEMSLFTGATAPSKRGDGYIRSTITFATPQVIENDLVSGRLELSQYSLVVIDEAHRATGDYAYVYIAKKFNEQSKSGILLAITASPGYDRTKVKDIMGNLSIERVHIESEESPDVSPYVHEIDLEWAKLDFPEELERSRRLLRTVYEEKIDLLMKYKLTSKPRQYLNRRDIIAMGEKLRKSIDANRQGNYYAAIMAQAAALKLSHAIEQLETQGAEALLGYFERVGKQKSKTSRELVRDGRITRALEEAGKYKGMHPKTKRLLEILSGLKEGQNAIVFSQYRDTTKRIADDISSLSNVRAVRFIGQASRNDDEGMSQKMQRGVLDEFKSGEYNVLVATSVAEEGLDIPSVDLVIFYEPIPSEIRTIQRRGRTGRRRSGKVIVLSMKGTVDEAYHKVALEKEKKMQKVMTQMGPRTKETKGQSRLDTYIDDERPAILCDSRENPQIVKLLSQRAHIEVRNLEVGDYILSGSIGLERKSTTDFLRSLFDNRLFEQVRSLSDTFEKAFVIVEGDELFSKNRTSRESVRSALISILVDFGVGIIFTRDIIDSADYIYQIARREQMTKRSVPRLRGEKRTKTIEEGMVFLLEGLPNVSSVLARRLLEHFGSVSAVLDADADALMKVEGIGKKKAEAIVELAKAKYGA